MTDWFTHCISIPCLYIALYAGGGGGGGVIGGFNLGLMRGNVDPEPGRCRRTDGKKWRCARDVMPDQKYCERHMHRGRHRARASKLSNNPNPNPNPNPNDASINPPPTTTTTTYTDTTTTTNAAAPNPNSSFNNPTPAHPQAASMAMAMPPSLSSSPLLTDNAAGGHALPMPNTTTTSPRSGIHPQLQHFRSLHSSNGVSSNPGTTNHVPNRLVSYDFTSNLIQSHPIPSHPIPSNLIQSNQIQSSPIQSHPIQSTYAWIHNIYLFQVLIYSSFPFPFSLGSCF